MPIFTQAQRTGTEGQLEVRLILQRELQFLPHHVAQEYDTGIDIIAEASHTGQGGRLHPEAKYIGVQVKSGESYFRTKKETGWVYAEDAAELDHWLSSSLPIVLVLHQAKVGAWWVEVTESAAQREVSRLRIEVPNSQPLTADARDALRSIANGEPRLVSRWESHVPILPGRPRQGKKRFAGLLTRLLACGSACYLGSSVTVLDPHPPRQDAHYGPASSRRPNVRARRHSRARAGCALGGGAALGSPRRSKAPQKPAATRPEARARTRCRAQTNARPAER